MKSQILFFNGKWYFGNGNMKSVEMVPDAFSPYTKMIPECHSLYNLRKYFL